MNATLQIMLVEDQMLFRRGLKSLLEEDSAVRVRCEASRACEALDLLAQGGIDVVMTDLSLPDRDGLWLIRHVQQDYPDVPVVVVSLHDDPRMVRRALQEGARGYLLKSATPEQMLGAIRLAARGEAYLQPELTTGDDDGSPLPSLSLAELDLLHFVRSGLDPSTVRERLGLSTPTYESRVRSVLRKLGVEDLPTAVARALEQSVLVPDEHP